jgi:hypothetical protein
MSHISSARNFNQIINDWIRNRYFAAAIVLIIVLVVFYRDIVFEGRTFLMETAAAGTMPNAGPYKYEGVTPGFVANDPGAIAAQIEPFNRFISRSIKKGDFPLWNPYAGLAGSPLLADGHTGPLEPIQFLFFFFPDHLWPLAIDGQLLVRFFLAGFGCYLFAQSQRINFFGSVSACLIFMLSSYFVTYGNHPQVKTEVLLPWVLYGYDRLANPKDRPGFWFCALFIGWAVIAAMPESTFFALFLGSLWYFYKSILYRQKSSKALDEAQGLILRYLGSTVLGFLISAAYLFPFLEYILVAKSIHSPGTGRDVYPLSLLPGLLFQTKTRFYLHIGFFTAFSLIFSLLNLKAWPKYRQHMIFFSLYAVIFILTLFGFPLTNWIRDLPVFNQLILEKYSIPSIVFCLAILAGVLIDRAGTLPISYEKLSLSLLILFIVFVGLPRIKNLESVSNFSSDVEFIYGALGLITGISIMLYVLAFYQRTHTFNHYIVWFSFLILVTLEPFFWGTRLNRPERIDPFQMPPFINYLDKNEAFRIFGFDGTLYPNISTAYRLADVRWLHALAPERAYDFSARFIEAAEVNSMRLTGTILPISDKMFNLLNVKYVLKQNSHIRDFDHCSFPQEDQPYFGKSNTFNPLIFEQNQGKKDFFPELPVDINGVTRMSIFAQSPQRFALDLPLPREASKLDFSIGLNPEVFLPEHGDGVTFRIVLLEQENRVEEIFSKYIDPKNRPCDRKWFDESVNLEKWAGKDVTLRFITTGGPSGDNSYDWAYWGDIQLTTPPAFAKVGGELTDTPYDLVYQDQDALIYQNKDAFPRAFIVYQVNNVASFHHALDVLKTANLDLRQVGVVENLPLELENKINQTDLQMPSVDGNATVISSGELNVEVSTTSPGLLIVSEQYYPGWNAYVNGKPTQVYAVDGILRGIFLEAGDYVVEFKYRPLSFVIGGILSAISLLTTIFCLIVYTRAPQTFVNNSPKRTIRIPIVPEHQFDSVMTNIKR